MERCYIGVGFWIYYFVYYFWKVKGKYWVVEDKDEIEKILVFDNIIILYF